MLETKKKNSFYILHILVTSLSFNEINYKKIMLLKHRYAGIEIIFHDMGNLCSDFPTDIYPITNYYKLQLENIINDTDKIIHLDIDTIILNDLNEFYSVNMENKFYKGILDSIYFNESDKFNTPSQHYINLGVSLINVGLLKKEKYFPKFLKFAKQHPNELMFGDQTIINSLCIDKIGYLKPKFSFFSYRDLNEALESNENRRTKYTKQELIEGYINPTLIHYYLKPKPWEYNFDRGYLDEWWAFTELNMFYNECISIINYTEFIDTMKIY